MFTLLVLLFFSGDTKKKSSENDQSTGHFQSFFIFIFFFPDPKSEKNSRKSTNKKIWPQSRFVETPKRGFVESKPMNLRTR